MIVDSACQAIQGHCLAKLVTFFWALFTLALRAEETAVAVRVDAYVSYRMILLAKDMVSWVIICEKICFIE